MKIYNALGTREIHYNRKRKNILIVKELQLKQSCSIIMGTLKHAELHRTRVHDLNSSLI